MGQSKSAINSLMRDMIDHQKHTIKILCTVIIFSICVNICTVIAFIWYESMWETAVVEESTTQTVDGDNAAISNVKGNQYNDSTHNNGVE